MSSNSEPDLESQNGDQQEPHKKIQPAPHPKQIIRLDDFIKRSGLVGTGGEAKVRIQSGEILVNGEVETRRRKQLAIGDKVEVMDEVLEVTNDYFD